MSAKPVKRPYSLYAAYLPVWYWQWCNWICPWRIQYLKLFLRWMTNGHPWVSTAKRKTRFPLQSAESSPSDWPHRKYPLLHPPREVHSSHWADLLLFPHSSGWDCWAKTQLLIIIGKPMVCMKNYGVFTVFLKKADLKSWIFRHGVINMHPHRQTGLFYLPIKPYRYAQCYSDWLRFNWHLTISLAFHQHIIRNFFKTVPFGSLTNTYQ